MSPPPNSSHIHSDSSSGIANNGIATNLLPDFVNVAVGVAPADDVAEAGPTSDIEYGEESNGEIEVVSIRVLLKSHPLKAFYRLQSWNTAQLTSAQQRDRSDVLSFVETLCGYDLCYDRDHDRFVDCHCLKGIQSDFYENIADVLGKFNFV